MRSSNADYSPEEEELQNGDDAELLSDVNAALHRITSFSEHDKSESNEEDSSSLQGGQAEVVTLSGPQLTKLRKLELRIRDVLSKPQKGFRRVVTGDANQRVRDHAKKLVRKAVTGSGDRRLREWARESRVVKTVDKFSFVLGVFALCTTEFMVLQYPQHFGVYYVVLVTIMMALRLYMYTKNRWLYFLLDFCYWANGSCFVSVLYLPNNSRLWRLNYAVSNGSLLGALLAWRNSLVFHSLDKVTSIAIHLLPGLLAYIERWKEYDMSPMCQHDSSENGCDPIGWSGGLFEPLLFYLSWQLLYICQTEILDRKRIMANPSIQTSLRWLTRDEKNAMHRMAKSVCRGLGILKHDEKFEPEALKTKLVFWIFQLLFIVVTLLPVQLLFEYHFLNTAYIILVLSAAVYNGSNYYFEVFAARYLQKFEEENSERIKQD